MALLIDEQKCTRDGICAAICPVQAITLADGQFPRFDDKTARNCILCGHCVAVCPQGALSLPDMASSACVSLPQHWRLTEEQVEYYFKGRRSVRHFEKRAVERFVLDRLISIASYAPSGTNRQPVYWSVAQNQAEVRHLAGLVIDWIKHLIETDSPLVAIMRFKRFPDRWSAGQDLICRDAPVLVVAHAEEIHPLSSSACTIALSHLELAASAFKLGACWAGFFQMAASVWPPLREALKIPEGHQSFGALMLGYPRFNFQRLPARIAPRVTWL